MSESARSGQEALDVSVPPPRITARGGAITAGLWLLYAVLVATIIAQAEGPPFVGALLGQGMEVFFLALGSLPVWWGVVRGMDEWHWGWVLGAHVLLAPLYSWATVEAFLGTLRLAAPPEAARAVAARYPWLLLTHLTLYGIQFSVFHLVRNFRRLRLKEQQATTLLARAREQELAALKAQVNPHFLFNTLNSISATLKEDPDRAREMIAKLAGLMRYALDSSDRQLVPLREELDFARRYLALERHRFSDRLETHIDLDVEEAALDTAVPPMTLQPLVENALRHGIAPSEDGGAVRIHVAGGPERLDIEVSDTGVGPADGAPLVDDSGGTGLSTTNARLTRIYGPDAALHTAPNQPSGLSVWFRLPRNGRGDA